MTFLNENKKLTLRWVGWFFFFNIFLVMLIGLHYLLVLSPLQSPALTLYGKFLMAFFVGFAFLGYLSALVLFPYLLLIIATIIFPWRRFILGFAVTLSTFLNTLLIIDTFIFRLYRLHLTGFMLDLILNGLGKDVIALSSLEWAMSLSIVAIIFILECLFAYVAWTLIKKNKLKPPGWKGLLCFLAFCLYLSISMVAFSAGQFINRQFTDASRAFPYYNYMLSLILPGQNRLEALNRMAEANLFQPRQYSGALNYPIHPLQCHPQSKPLNLVIIAIDTWRYDMLNPTVTPAIENFAHQSSVYTDHWSGGNATAPGIFSLFYGLPATYWTAMQSAKRSPVFIETLLKNHYLTGVFASAPLDLPAFNENVFVDIPHLILETPGESPYDRDQFITKEFIQFINQAKKENKPFFSFLFYDSVHTYCAFSEDLKPFHPVIKVCERLKLTATSDPIPYLNRYKNALLLVDHEIAKILQALKENHLLDNTVVLITADHGEAFNDNHLGYWGHASDYTPYQVRIPLVVYWPGMPTHTIHYQTSHFDIVPTLMTRFFHCINPPSDYSVGKLLSDTSPRNNLIIGSYIGFGIVEPDRFTSVFPTGDFEIKHANGEPFPEAPLDKQAMQNALYQMRRFYRQ